MIKNVKSRKMIWSIILIGLFGFDTIILAENSTIPSSRSRFTIKFPLTGLTGTSRINVMEVGAKGDGITDDTMAIQKAVQTNRGTIYFPSGTYLVTSPIIIEQSGISLEGDQAKILFKLEANQPISLRQLREGKTGMAELPNSVFIVKGNLENSNWDLAETAPVETTMVKTMKPANLIPGDIII